MTVGLAMIGAAPCQHARFIPTFPSDPRQPAVQACKHLTLKAVYSRSSRSAQSLAVGADVQLYSDDAGSGRSCADVLKRSDIQAVIIALPIPQQPEYIRLALSAGKHVLSEKPIAENVKDAQDLLQWYHANVDANEVTWSVAENFRYLASFEYAREQVRRAGRLLGFSAKRYSMVQGGKYFETEWRKNPTHQGGFLLDGGVHVTAGLRFLLGSDNAIASLSAYSAQLQKHLPPVDTIDATMRTKSGVTGTFSVSFGTSFKGYEFSVACDGGTVQLSIFGSTVTTVFDGKEEKRVVQDERTGVPPEVRTWGEALVAGERNEKQEPEEALADLELSDQRE
ncbi:glucose-fructose oxidoreductase [Usnea florida]